MPFLIINKKEKSVPSDPAITTAMESCTGQVTKIEGNNSSKRVDFTGDVNHNNFENELERIAKGNKMSWEFQWADREKTIESRTLTAPVTYSLTYTNNSANAWDFCCFQKNPDYDSAAWFVARTIHPTTTITFSWEISYALTWAKTGKLSPGILYIASQSWGVDQDKNAVTLTKKDGSYTFTDLRQEDPTSSYIIKQDGAVVNQDGASIGISMKITTASTGNTGFSPVYAQQAQPNITSEFSITPNYWVVFQQKVNPSQILSLKNMTNPYQVVFEEGVYAKSVMLDKQNKWHDLELAKANEAFLRAEEEMVLSPATHWSY
jgi:hypothetical protein